MCILLSNSTIFCQIAAFLSLTAMQLVFQQYAIIAHLPVPIVVLGRICKHHNLGCVHIVMLPAQALHARKASRGFLRYLENYDPITFSLKGYFH